MLRGPGDFRVVQKYVQSQAESAIPGYKIPPEGQVDRVVNLLGPGQRECARATALPLSQLQTDGRT